MAITRYAEGPGNTRSRIPNRCFAATWAYMNIVLTGFKANFFIIIMNFYYHYLLYFSLLSFLSLLFLSLLLSVKTSVWVCDYFIKVYLMSKRVSFIHIFTIYIYKKIFSNIFFISLVLKGCLTVQINVFRFI